MTQKFLKNEWNLGLLYSSVNDPQMEKDMIALEGLCESFSKAYAGSKKFLTDTDELIRSIDSFFSIIGKMTPKPILYLTFTLHKDASNTKAQSLINLYTDRATKAVNKLNFYPITLGKIPAEEQKKLLSDAKLSHYRFFLERTFLDAKYNLTEAEERILSLKKLPSSDMWMTGHDKVLSSLTVQWKNKTLPVDEAIAKIAECTKSDRDKLWKLVITELKKIAAFSEAEMNALVTDKKIDDELRGFKTSFESTIKEYKNDPKTVELLAEIVAKNFPVSHSFYKIKAKLLKQKSLGYQDRAANYAKVTGDFSFQKSKESLLEVFGNFDKKYAKILNDYITKGQIDAFPKKGKHGGAYCWGTYENPTFVLLNHADDFRSYTTFAHEMGHAFHTELSKPLGPVYSNYSTSLAETASTFFEAVAFDAIIETLPKKQKVIALHNRINEDIATIFRQIACFNYEKEIHETVRKNGFISKEELADLHNKHMKAYLGPAFKMEHDDGFFFVRWGHIRQFFYVYTYAYGLLVSKALFKKYKENKKFITTIEKFLSSGGRETPENILKDIGIDVTTGQLFQDGIDELKNDIKRLETMLKEN